MLATSIERTYTTTLPSGDAADVYLPGARPRRGRTCPLIAVLQGACVDKAQYARLGRTLARRGFVVVIPNHLRPFPGYPEPVLFSEVDVVGDVRDAATEATADPGSPLYGLVDTDTMGLVGHSLGGSVGLYAIAGECPPGIGRGDRYSPPAALRAAAVYGTSLFDFRTDALITLDTSRAAVALVHGSRDGIATPEKMRQSYAVLPPPRALIRIEGANHYAICRDDAPLGAVADPKGTPLSQRAAGAAAAEWIALWLQARLRGDWLARLRIERIGRSYDGRVRVTSDLGTPQPAPPPGG